MGAKVVKINYETKKIPMSLTMTMEEFTKSSGHSLASLITDTESEFTLDGWSTTIYKGDAVEILYEGKPLDPKKMKVTITPDLQGENFDFSWEKVNKDE